jgi:site-specific DNA-methyltransferase (adenine-specific)
MGQHTLHLGDCLDVLRAMADCSVDAVVTDPPYGLAFMGKRWDYDVPSVEIWAECLRVLKPGGHLLAFAGTRTQHRMAVRIEDAGFEIRDLIMWVYGSGFPKSLDVSKAIDKAAGAEREVVGAAVYGEGHVQRNGGDSVSGYSGGLTTEGEGVRTITAPATPEAQQWAGWGTALKPALEPITMARKPLAGTVAANVLEHGTGALNVDGCRVGTEPPAPRNAPKKIIRGGKFHAAAEAEREMSHFNPTSGRWPANLIHDGSDEVVGLFPLNESPQPRKTKRSPDSGTRTGYGTFAGQEDVVIGFGDSGSAARFFYTAKATKAERQGVTHPTVKPLDLMAYLCRLVTPPGGTVLDPFMGSGTTIKAAISEGFNAIGIERDPQYFAMAEHRMNGAQLGLSLITP